MWCVCRTACLAVPKCGTGTGTVRFWNRTITESKDGEGVQVCAEPLWREGVGYMRSLLGGGGASVCGHPAGGWGSNFYTLPRSTNEINDLPQKFKPATIKVALTQNCGPKMHETEWL